MLGALYRAPKFEGLHYLVAGKTRKTCFGDNKNRPGRQYHRTNAESSRAQVVDRFISRKGK